MQEECNEDQPFQKSNFKNIKTQTRIITSLDVQKSGYGLVSLPKIAHAPFLSYRIMDVGVADVTPDTEIAERECHAVVRLLEVVDCVPVHMTAACHLNFGDITLKIQMKFFKTDGVINKISMM